MLSTPAFKATSLISKTPTQNAETNSQDLATALEIASDQWPIQSADCSTAVAREDKYLKFTLARGDEYTHHHTVVKKKKMQNLSERVSSLANLRNTIKNHLDENTPANELHFQKTSIPTYHFRTYNAKLFFTA